MFLIILLYCININYNIQLYNDCLDGKALTSMIVFEGFDGIINVIS
jgi:hypothetical protein